MAWEEVAAVLPYAKVITWDGCHKIYILMDDAQVEEMRSYGYADEGEDQFRVVKTPEASLRTLQEWFEESCALRFVNAVKTVEGDPNEGFQQLIAQFEMDEDEDEECENCGNSVYDGERICYDCAEPEDED